MKGKSSRDCESGYGDGGVIGVTRETCTPTTSAGGVRSVDFVRAAALVVSSCCSVSEVGVPHTEPMPPLLGSGLRDEGFQVSATSITQDGSQQHSGWYKSSGPDCRLLQFSGSFPAIDGKRY